MAEQGDIFTEGDKGTVSSNSTVEKVVTAASGEQVKLDLIKGGLHARGSSNSDCIVALHDTSTNTTYRAAWQGTIDSQIRVNGPSVEHEKPVYIDDKVGLKFIFTNRESSTKSWTYSVSGLVIK